MKEKKLVKRLVVHFHGATKEDLLWAIDNLKNYIRDGTISLDTLPIDLVHETGRGWTREVP